MLRFHLTVMAFVFHSKIDFSLVATQVNNQKYQDLKIKEQADPRVFCFPIARSIYVLSGLIFTSSQILNLVRMFFQHGML